MNQPWIYMCTPSRSPLSPPSPSHPSGSSQCTIPEQLSHASNLGWRSVSPLIVHLFQCYFLRTFHPRLLPESQSLFCTKVAGTFFVHPAQAPICSMSTLSHVGPEFRVLPRFKPFRVLGAHQGHWQLLTIFFVPSPGKSHSDDLVVGKILSKMSHATYAPHAPL